MKRMKKLLAVMLAAMMVLAMGTSVWADGAYTITISDDIKNGIVTAGVSSADEGDTVTLTVTPYNGYELSTITVTYNGGETLTPTGSGSTYTFTMPAYDVTVTATFTATSSNTYTLTIENDVADYAYTYYQIFTGNLASDGETLTDIEWGSDITDAGKVALRTKYSLDDDADAAAVAAAIIDADDAQDLAEALAADGSYLGTGTAMTYDATTGTYYATGLASGYYLVVNTAVPSTGTETSYSNYIVQVVANTTIEPKSDVASVTKSVNDKDVYIGQTVTYTLTASLPSNYASYDVYSLTFHDTLSSGLTYNSDSVKVYVDDTEVASSCYEVSTSNNDDCTLEVKISDTNSLTDTQTSPSAISVTSSSVIKVEYTATVDSDAVTGNSGTSTNSNSVYLEYSNNPNNTGSGGDTGITTTSTVPVFTYELDLKKVEYGTSNGLEGATFYLKDSSGNYLIANGSSGSYTVTGWTDQTSSGATLLESPSGGLISIKGLSTGTYYLQEVSAPDGYNKLTSDVTIVIAATYSDEDGDGVEDTIATLTITINGAESSGTVATGLVSGSIENNKGSNMPTTGGIGTTIFYILGSILALSAAVVLVTRRRMAR